MIKPVRIGIVLLLALAASLSVNAASSQTLATLNVVVETEDGSEIPDGQVCVTGEGDPICQDVGGNPSGREFSFPDLTAGADYEVTVNAGDYLEAVDSVTLSEETTTITLTLVMEQTAPPADDVLPDTGSGSTANIDANSQALMLITGGLAVGLLSLSLLQRRRER